MRAGQAGSPSYSPSISERTIEQRGAEQVGDHRGQAVVVAERGLQLIDADGVVFVDDRHRAEVEQREQRVADVEIADAVIDVFEREQHLGRAAAVFGERAVVGLNQMRLADGGDGLQLGQVGRPRFQAEQADARADRAAADQHDAPAAVADRVNFFGELLDPLVVERAVGLREHARADLDDDRVGGGGDLLAERFGRRRRWRSRQASGRLARRRTKADAARPGAAAENAASDIITSCCDRGGGCGAGLPRHAAWRRAEVHLRGREDYGTSAYGGDEAATATFRAVKTLDVALSLQAAATWRNLCTNVLPACSRCITIHVCAISRTTDQEGIACRRLPINLPPGKPAFLSSSRTGCKPAATAQPCARSASIFKSARPTA